MTDKPKRPRDANQLAKFIVDLATGEEPEHEPDTSGQRKGGLKGGKARADKLSPEERIEIAKKAARARWAE
ncbi:MAG: histone H1 [Pararhodobacter sp.]